MTDMWFGLSCKVDTTRDPRSTLSIEFPDLRQPISFTVHIRIIIQTTSHCCKPMGGQLGEVTRNSCCSDNFR